MKVANVLLLFIEQRIPRKDMNFKIICMKITYIH